MWNLHYEKAYYQRQAGNLNICPNQIGKSPRKSPDVIYPPYMDLHLVISSQPVSPPSLSQKARLVRVCPEKGDRVCIMPFATWCCFSTSQTYNAETPIPYLKSPCFPSVSSAEAASEMEVGSTR